MISLFRACTLSAAALGASCVASGEDIDGVANYAYSVFVGTGRYAIQDRVIYVFRAPLAMNIRDIDLEADRNVGVRLLAPFAIGVTDYEKLEDFPELVVESLQTISIVPGVEVPIALSDHWRVAPFAQAGAGMDVKSDSRSFIWGAGVRLRGEYGEASRWKVGGEFLWAGNDPNKDDPTTRFSRWGLGAEYKIPTKMMVADRYISWHIRAIQWYFTDAVDFEKPLLSSGINRSHELGLSFGLSHPVRVLGYDFTQLGVGYEWSKDLSAVKFFTTFPF